MRDGFRKEIEINHKKGHWDVVTQYDLAADKFIQDRIKRKFPKHSILSEETGGRRSAGDLWIIDPLDGTRNFSRGIPTFCTSIAYAKNGKQILGAIYDPVHDELFFAQKDKVATLNGKKISVAAVDDPEFALCSVAWNSSSSTAKEVARLQKFIAKTRIWNSSISSGALALAYVACGRYDFDIMLKAYPWDYAAGVLIAREAGAIVTELDGKNYTLHSECTVTANPKLHKMIIQALK